MSFAPLKILHTGDIHIGMKYQEYPSYIKDRLVEARFEVLERLIGKANEERCNIFAVAGDLFDKLNIPKREIVRVINILRGFAGDCVLLLPGNHDYESGGVDLWDTFQKNISGNIILLNEHRPYSLEEFDLDVVVYPAHCHAKRSAGNNLAWIKEMGAEVRREQKDTGDEDEEKEGKGDMEGMLRLGIAHGALAGISPDLDGSYFMMDERELEELGLDLWLLGHTHIPYPGSAEVRNRIVLNSGTPEPDGMDCSHGGSAWLISVDDNRQMEARRLNTGIYRFYDLKYRIEDRVDLEKVKRSVLEGDCSRKVVRLTLTGRIDEDLFKNREEIYRKMRDRLAYLSVVDGDLKLRINQDVIDREFSGGSLPYRFLKELAAAAEEDDALQLAYELIKEVRQ